MASSALTKARDALMKAHSHVTKLRGHGEAAMGEALRSAEGVVGAAGMGYVDEKYGVDNGDGIKQATITNHVPTSLGVGILGKALAFMKIAGKHSEHVHGLASGVLDAWGYNLGRAAAKKQAASGK